jgi:hypothetical protein
MNIGGAFLPEYPGLLYRREGNTEPGNISSLPKRNDYPPEMWPFLPAPFSSGTGNAAHGEPGSRAIHAYTFPNAEEAARRCP